MPDTQYLTQSEIVVLVAGMIKEHEEEISQPKHVENQATLKDLQLELRHVVLDLTEMKATQSIIVKFAAAGIVVWSIRQLVELVQSFHH